MNDDLAPREPTAPEAKAAFEVETRIKQTVRRMRDYWIELAADLYKFNDLELWRDLGYSSFETWLAGPEIDLERRHVYYLLQAHRELVIRRNVDRAQLDGVEYSKVQEILPAIRRGHVDVATALADCQALGRSDLRERYAKLGASKPAGGGPEADRFEATDEPEWALCPTCGSRYKREAA